MNELYTGVTKKLSRTATAQQFQNDFSETVGTQAKCSDVGKLITDISCT